MYIYMYYGAINCKVTLLNIVRPTEKHFLKYILLILKIQLESSNIKFLRLHQIHLFYKYFFLLKTEKNASSLIAKASLFMKNFYKTNK